MAQVDFVIFNTVNFPGSAGLPIINQAPNEFSEDFPALYGNVDFAFSVAFSLTDAESGTALNIIDISVLSAPEFVNHQVISNNAVRISVKPGVTVFPGEVFELLINDQIVLNGTISLTANTNIVEGFNTKFTEELQVGNDIIVLSTGEKFKVNNIINDTTLEIQQTPEESIFNSSFSLADISEFTANDVISPGSYKTILQWVEPPVKELQRSYTFAITYIVAPGEEGESDITAVINTSHVQVFFWHYIPSLQKFDSLIAGSIY